MAGSPIPPTSRPRHSLERLLGRSDDEQPHGPLQDDIGCGSRRQDRHQQIPSFGSPESPEWLRGAALWGGHGGADEAPEADGIAVLGEGASALRPAVLWKRNEPRRSRVCHQPLTMPELGGRRCPQRDFASLNALVLAFLRAPSNHINIRILQTMNSGIHSIVPWNQNVRSLCLCGLLRPYPRP